MDLMQRYLVSAPGRNREGGPLLIAG